VVLVRFHVPFDATSHVLMLGGEPEFLAVDAVGENPGITLMALRGGTPRVFRVFEWGGFLPAGGARLIGEARGHGLRWFLYEMPG